MMHHRRPLAQIGQVKFLVGLHHLLRLVERGIYAHCVRYRGFTQIFAHGLEGSAQFRKWLIKSAEKRTRTSTPLRALEPESHVCDSCPLRTAINRLKSLVNGSKKPD